MTECTLSFHSQECPIWKFTKVQSIVLCTVNPLLSRSRGGGGANLFQTHLMGGLFNLEETKVLVLHKELEYEVEKLKYKKLVCE